MNAFDRLSDLAYYLMELLGRILRRRSDVLAEGDKVTLNVPQNPKLHGQVAMVRKLTQWGAYVGCTAAATGEYRALFSEMEAERRAAPPLEGYTGDVCCCCGGSRMRRAGACSFCEECGTTSGCS